MPAGRGKEVFNIHMYNNSKSTALLNQVLCEMYHRIEAANPTQFHLMLEALAEEGRLHRLYTQNIDGIDTQLPQLNTLIPLPKKKPWPKTVQLHGDLRTVRCLKNPTHLSRFDPALFASGSLPCCAVCEQEELSNEGKRRSRKTPVARPRIWLYQDLDHPDADAIDRVSAADMQGKPDAVIVAGTALKVQSAKIFARDICRAAHEHGGFTAWINLKAPPADLDCFDLVVKGKCDAVAEHVSSWWLRECPAILNDIQIQELQKKCKIFIAKSVEVALNRSLAEVDNMSLSKALQQKENKSRVLNAELDGERIFLPRESLKFSDPTSKADNLSTSPQPSPESLSPEGSDILPHLPDYWEKEMTKRLSKVVVEKTADGHKSSSIVTPITELGYGGWAEPEKSLWRLKPEVYLNDEIINAYLKLLQESALAGHYIQKTFAFERKPNNPLKSLAKIISTGVYIIYLPINIASLKHWTFAVITSEKKEGPLLWEYYDSLGGGPPGRFLDWIAQVSHKEVIQQATASPNPRQNNNFDCGLFVLMGIRLLSTGRRHLAQAQSDDIIPRFRQRILAELLAVTLNPSGRQFADFRQKEALVNTGNMRDNDETSTTINRGEKDQPELFVSPTPMSDPEDTEGGYSEDSEDDVQRSRKKPTKKKSPEQIAFAFAEEASIVKMLRDAVLIERVLQKEPKSLEVESTKLADLWLMVGTEKHALKQRYIHYEFSRLFWAEFAEFNRSPHQRGPMPKSIVSKVMRELEITDQANWKYIIQRARRASIWIELADIFKDNLKYPSVVLCAIPDTTYTLETLTLADRKVFFETIRSRLGDPKNRILARLKAASTLYWAVINNNLPANKLLIESANEDLLFKHQVSCGNL
jgi:NAD+-dependent protein deacetylase SIR2